VEGLMKKFIFLNGSFFILSLLISIISYADNNEPGLIKNWKPFYSHNGITFSYEYSDDSNQKPQIHTFDNASGKEFFYLRLDITDVLKAKMISRDKNSSVLKRDDYGYDMLFVRWDNNKKLLYEIEEYSYSKKNELILKHTLNTNPMSASDSRYVDKFYKALMDIKEPEFPGGGDALNIWLSENIIYNAMAQRQGIEGTVEVQFNVSETGKISDIKIIKSVHKLLDMEAIRLIKSMPDWVPGSTKGMPSGDVFTMPIHFILR
jgi:TonB family protein